MEVVREFDEACIDKAHSLESNNAWKSFINQLGLMVLLVDT